MLESEVHLLSPPETQTPPRGKLLLSIVTPAFNEELNLPVLYEQFKQVMEGLETRYDWEWVLVDDHSSDATFATFSKLAESDSRLRGFRFSRNYGSHKALTCGLREARGDCAVVLAADLQDPPATIPALLAEHEQGSQIIWAVRQDRKGEGFSTILFSRLYYKLMKSIVGMQNMPATGADFFMLDRVVLDVLKQFNENNVSVMALLSVMGFRQSTIQYVKEARLHGNSGWTLAKKLKLVVDSVTAFTYAPIRLMVYVGSVITLLSFAYLSFIFFNSLGPTGSPVQGWASLMVVTLFLGGSQMMMTGILGEYTWRALDEVRARPIYLVESRTPDKTK